MFEEGKGCPVYGSVGRGARKHNIKLVFLKFHHLLKCRKDIGRRSRTREPSWGIRAVVHVEVMMAY